MTKRDFLSILDATEDLQLLLEDAADMKARSEQGEARELLPHKSLALLFEKPSTRTRLSFEVGMAQLGGVTHYLSREDLQLGRGETLEDTARVMSRYVDAIVYRAHRHDDVIRLARAASVPVLNGLDEVEHPCQVLADLFTIWEAKGQLAGTSLAYVGDGNNVCHSLLLGCALAGVHIAVATPPGFDPDAAIVQRATKLATNKGSTVELMPSPQEAVSDADVVYTDTWVSMGMEEERAKREKAFAGYQVNGDLLGLAAPDARVMHCLPAHRGEEITDAVLDGPASLVWEQAENRLHAQKALLVHLMVG